MRRQDAVNQLYNWLTATTLMMDGELRTVHGRHTTTDKAYLQVRLRHFDNKGYTLDWTKVRRELMPQSMIEFPMATPEDTAAVFRRLNTMPTIGNRLLAYMVNERNVETIRKWRRGDALPSEFQLNQLKLLADEVKKLRSFDSDNTIKAFLTGETMDGELANLDLIRLNQFSEFRGEVARFIANG